MMLNRRVKDWLQNPRRRGATLVMFAFLLVFVIAMVAFAVDIGFLTLTKTRLQNAADAASLAAAQELDVNAADQAHPRRGHRRRAGRGQREPRRGRPVLQRRPGPSVRADGVRRLEVQL